MTLKKFIGLLIVTAVLFLGSVSAFADPKAVPGTTETIVTQPVISILTTTK